MAAKHEKTFREIILNDRDWFTNFGSSLVILIIAVIFFGLVKITVPSYSPILLKTTSNGTHLEGKIATPSIFFKLNNQLEIILENGDTSQFNIISTDHNDKTHTILSLAPHPNASPPCFPDNRPLLGKFYTGEESLGSSLINSM